MLLHCLSHYCCINVVALTPKKNVKVVHPPKTMIVNDFKNVICKLEQCIPNVSSLHWPSLLHFMSQAYNISYINNSLLM